MNVFVDEDLIYLIRVLIYFYMSQSKFQQRNNSFLIFRIRKRICSRISTHRLAGKFITDNGHGSNCRPLWNSSMPRGSFGQIHPM